VAVSVPRRHGQGLQFHAVCGAQYSTEVQQRPLTATSQRDHQHTNLAGATAKRPAAPLVRDEEAAGANPATPTQVTGHSPQWDMAFFYAVQQQSTRAAGAVAGRRPERACGTRWDVQNLNGKGCKNVCLEVRPDEQARR
jgi:hypothetical protein